MEPEEDDDSMMDFWNETHPEPTPEETAKMLKGIDECSAYIRKYEITPNLDSIY